MQLFQKGKVESKLQERIEEFERRGNFLRCFRPVQAFGFDAALHAYGSALKIMHRDGLDAAKKVYSSRQIFVPEFISRDISTILETGQGLFDTIEDLPSFIAREQKIKEEKRVLLATKMSEERRAMKFKTKMVLEQQAEKRKQFELETGVRIE